MKTLRISCFSQPLLLLLLLGVSKTACDDLLLSQLQLRAVGTWFTRCCRHRFDASLYPLLTRPLPLLTTNPINSFIHIQNHSSHRSLSDHTQWGRYVFGETQRTYIKNEP